uniref:Dolichyldiphosphatase n=1 Tax=Suricata suricatta TaxID=37032 RepID=A0A673TQW7_SURSU
MAWTWVLLPWPPWSQRGQTPSSACRECLFPSNSALGLRSAPHCWECANRPGSYSLLEDLCHALSRALLRNRGNRVRGRSPWDLTSGVSRSDASLEVQGFPGDLSGHLLAYLSLSPVFVIVGFVTLIIFKRELHTISFLGGLVLNEGVNWLIKHVIQEPRPCGGPHAAVGTKYGMPSSHSQFMWFFSVYSFLFLYLRMHQTNNARFLDLLWRHVLSLGLLTAAFLVSYSRVYLLYHTWSQVLCGGLAGSLMAIAWFAFTQEVLTPLFPRIAAWPISEFFLIRDTSLIPNVLWFEYTVTRAEAR